MADNYRKLPSGPNEPQEGRMTQFVEKKYLGITFKEYGYFLGSIIIITILNIVTRDYLYQLTIDIILKLQEDGREPFWNWFFKYISKLGDSHTLYGLLLLIYVFKSRALALHYTMIISTMMFFLCFMKMIVRFPRPYQYHDDIIPTSCSGQWGCPSATSIRVGTMVMSVYLDFVYDQRNRMHPILYGIGSLLTFVGIFGVMCSRVYLAAHSINQVIFGSVIGIEIALFLHFCVKPRLYKHLAKLQTKSPLQTNYNSLVLNAVIMFILSQITFIAYYYVSNFTEIDPKYRANLLRKCPGEITAKIFHEAAFPYIGKTALGFFGYLGVLVHHKYFTSNASNETGLRQSIPRLGLSFIIVWIFVKQLELVDWYSSIWLLYFNKTFIPCGGAAFLLCALGDSVFEQIGLMNKDQGRKYCVFLHESEENDDSQNLNDSNNSEKTESLLSKKDKQNKV